MEQATTQPTPGPSLRAGVLWNLVPIALLAGVGLGLNFAIGRIWGSSALGVFNQVTATYFVLAIFGAGGINYSILRSVAERPTDRPHVARVVVGGFVPTLLLASLITFVFVLARHRLATWLDSPDVAIGMLWAAPGLFCFTLNKVLLGTVNGLGRMRALAVYTSLRYLLLAAGLLIAWRWNFDAARLPGLWTLAEGTLLLVLFADLLATIELRAATGWQRWVRRHLDYGVRGVGAVLLIEINTRLDIWLLGAMLSDAKVGVYSMAAIMAEGIAQLPVAVQVNVNPRIAASFAASNPTAVRDLIRTIRRWFIAAMIGTCIVAAGVYPLVIPWITQDPEFLGSAIPFALLVTGLALASPWLPFNQVLLMAGHPGWHTLYMVIVVVMNLCLNLLLIPRLELLGAGIATGLTFALSALILRWLAQRILRFRL